MRGRKKNIEMVLGGVIVGLYFSWGLIYFVYSLMGENEFYLQGDMKKELLSPLSSGFIWGTDLYGRSVFHVVSKGLIYSLGIGLFVTGINALLGVVFGNIAATTKGILGRGVSSAINLAFILPGMVLAIFILGLMESSFWGMIFALVFSGWAGPARVARGEIQRALTLDFVESSKALGAENSWIFFRHLLPSIWPQMMVHMVLGVSGVILSEATLSFLGLGHSGSSWGTLFYQAKGVLLEAPYLIAILSILMSGLVLGLNLLGDGLRDYWDPRNAS